MECNAYSNRSRNDDEEQRIRKKSTHSLAGPPQSLRRSHGSTVPWRWEADARRASRDVSTQSRPGINPVGEVRKGQKLNY